MEEEKDVAGGVVESRREKSAEGEGNKGVTRRKVESRKLKVERNREEDFTTEVTEHAETEGGGGRSGPGEVRGRRRQGEERDKGVWNRTLRGSPRGNLSGQAG